VVSYLSFSHFYPRAPQEIDEAVKMTSGLWVLSSSLAAAAAASASPSLYNHVLFVLSLSFSRFFSFSAHI
jgi:hypothetical protein